MPTATGTATAAVEGSSASGRGCSKRVTAGARKRAASVSSGVSSAGDGASASGQPKACVAAMISEPGRTDLAAAGGGPTGGTGASDAAAGETPTAGSGGGPPAAVGGLLAAALEPVAVLPVAAGPDAGAAPSWLGALLV